MPRTAVTTRLLEQRQEGMQSEYTLRIVAPLVDQAEKRILGRLKERFRAGERDQLDALLAVAQLVALGDLRDGLEHAVERGNRAVDRLMDEGT